MRKIALAGMSTLSGLVLLFSYHTSLNSSAEAATETASAATGSSSTSSSASSGSSDSDWAADDPSASATQGSSGSSSATQGSSGSASATQGSSGSSSGTFTGDAVQTRWGPVQVQITVANGKITKAEAIQYPQENHRDIEINSYAVPALNQETVAAQSADLDAISGATVTTNGYIQSLQSALDQANL